MFESGTLFVGSKIQETFHVGSIAESCLSPKTRKNNFIRGQVTSQNSVLQF